jgi:hypothetical protein
VLRAHSLLSQQKQLWAEVPTEGGTRNRLCYKLFSNTLSLFNWREGGNLQEWYKTVGIAAGQPSGRSSSPGRCDISLLSTLPKPILRPTQPPIQCVPVLKRPVRQVHHSTNNFGVKTRGSIQSLPPYFLHDENYALTYKSKRKAIPVTGRGGL